MGLLSDGEVEDDPAQPSDLPPHEHSDALSDEENLFQVRWYLFPEGLKGGSGKYHASFRDPARICCNKYSTSTSDLLPMGLVPPSPIFVCGSCLLAQPSLYRLVVLEPPPKKK